MAMVDNYFVEARRRNKIQLMDFLTKNNKELTLKQALGQFSFKTGLKVSTLQQWTDELIDAGYLKIEKGVIL